MNTKEYIKYESVKNEVQNKLASAYIVSAIENLWSKERNYILKRAKSLNKINNSRFLDGENYKLINVEFNDSKIEIYTDKKRDVKFWFKVALLTEVSALPEDFEGII